MVQRPFRIRRITCGTPACPLTLEASNFSPHAQESPHSGKGLQINGLHEIGPHDNLLILLHI